MYSVFSPDSYNLFKQPKAKIINQSSHILKVPRQSNYDISKATSPKPTQKPQTNKSFSSISTSNLNKSPKPEKEINSVNDIIKNVITEYESLQKAYETLFSYSNNLKATTQTVLRKFSKGERISDLEQKLLQTLLLSPEQPQYKPQLKLTGIYQLY